MKQNKFPREKSIALLLDPDKTEKKYLCSILKTAAECNTDYILAGGSLSFTGIDQLIDSVRQLCHIPIVLFPGNLLQLSRKADFILLLSLKSAADPKHRLNI
jgi:putative glycerol-1-phosphate prenyltransferase